MSTGEPEHESPTTLDPAAEGAEPAAVEAEPAKTKLDLDVQITDAGPCKKHLNVAISRADIDGEFDKTFGTMKREAQVPGFRPGKAPRALVERWFRKQVSGQVKSNLLMACLAQLDEDYKIKPITTPNLDIDAIDLPDDGPMTFELEVEVQPEFPLPAYKALVVKRPTRSITEQDVDNQYTAFLERYAQLVPKSEGGAEVGDFVTADLTFRQGDRLLNEAKELQFRLQPELRFQDGRVPDLASALTGAAAGDVREANAEIGSASPDPSLRGQTVRVEFKVLDLKQLRLPEADASFLSSVGFDSVDDLRGALRGVLQRRLEFQQRQAVRREILDQLLNETPFDLPADLVARQEASTIRRRVMEMREGGLGDGEIRAREAEIRANAHEATTRSLKEFFLLSAIAEAEGVKVEEEDFDQEIEAISARTDESPRRVRARVEKEGLADALASQILERKALDRIMEYVKIEEVEMVDDSTAVETLDQTASGSAPASGEGAAG